MAGVTSVVIDGTTYLVDDINAVDFSEDQGLSEQQQQQGRSNIGAASDAEFTEALADKASAIVDTASGAIASFPDGAAVPAKDITIGIEPVQAGSGDPSPTNVRPISGWTGANVARTGMNLLAPTEYCGSYNNQPGNSLKTGAPQNWTQLLTGISVDIKQAWSGRLFATPVLSAGTYTIKRHRYENQIEPRATWYITDSDYNVVRVLQSERSFGEYAQYSADVQNGQRIAYFCGANAASIITVTSPMVYSANAVDPPYAPYIGTTYPISWQSEAGTVYGGTLDVTTGLLTVTMAEVDLGTLTTWVYYSDLGILNAPVPGMLYTSQASERKKGILSSMYPVATNATASTAMTDKSMFRDGGRIYIRDTSYTDADTFKAALSGVQLVYELATPQTYQLTPTEVEMLLGDNNVWADTGDSTVTYRADTKLYIQKINAPTDDDMIADAQIASGKYFIIGGNLYKSTTTIPAGDTITPGTNCILTNLADALNALNT